MEEYLLERIEWEVLRNKIIIEKLISLDKLPEGSERIEIWRNDSYKINARIYGRMNNYAEQTELKEGVAGTIVSTFSVEGADSYGIFKYTLNHCYMMNIRKNIVLDGAVNFEADLRISELKVQLYKQEESESHVEWFLNGPSGSDFIFPRCTERCYSKTYERKRHSVDENSKVYLGGINKNSNRDFAFIDAGAIKYILSKVPRGLGPEWSNSISIEYRREWGEIPEQPNREAIAEITSFIFGKQLLNVGYSNFNLTGQEQEHLASDPWGDNTVSLCQSSELLPIRFTYHDFDRLEKVMSQMIPMYLELRNTLNLNEALWRYWISRTLPVGTNLPILHAGVEILAKAWFKSNKSKTKGVYIPQKEFNKLIEKGMVIIVTDLQEQIYGDRMIRKMSNAYQMTQNEQLSFFFNEIGLNIGDVENAALKGRNVMTHSSSGQTDEELNKLIYLTRSYQALFHRIFLKILGYTGDYVDYSTKGWPERNIDEPLGGNK